MIPKLEKAYQESNHSNGQAVILIFLTHLIGDVYQPLHVITKVNFFCASDVGGNDYCLTLSNYGNCKYSLHKLWDNGVGLFRGYINYQTLATQLNNPNLPMINLNHEVERAVNLTEFIYSTPKNKMPDESYYRQAQSIVKIQLLSSADSLRTALSK